MTKILLDIYKDKYLSNILGFKGGSAAMFFYHLPRFSVDLDFDLLKNTVNLDISKLILKIKNIIGKYGEITDFKDKYYTILFEISYGEGSRRLKIEISKRITNSNYQIINFFGENMLVMDKSDMLTNKLFTLLNRKGIANRDIFDIRYFFSQVVNINQQLLGEISNIKSDDFLKNVSKFLENYDFNKILYGLGELIDNKMKNFAKTKMKNEILGYLNYYY